MRKERVSVILIFAKHMELNLHTKVRSILGGVLWSCCVPFPSTFNTMAVRKDFLRKVSHVLHIPNRLHLTESATPPREQKAMPDSAAVSYSNLI